MPKFVYGFANSEIYISIPLLYPTFLFLYDEKGVVVPKKTAWLTIDPESAVIPLILIMSRADMICL